MPNLSCPRCASTRIADVLIGLPLVNKTLERRLARGEVVFGGCLMTGNEPEHHCRDCAHEWRSSPPMADPADE